ncbi:MAG: hypothetical protein ABW061_21850 [Polyangiaceae bacterium]
MANRESKRLGRAQRLAALFLAGTLVAGCTQTTTNVRSLPGPSVEHIHLTRAGVIPVAGAFRQEGHSIVGQLAFTTDCTAESRQIIRQQVTTDTHQDRRASIALTVVGATVAAAGVGLLAASSDADQEVSCGQGRAGDRCQSESSALMELGLSALLSGLTAGVAGGYLLAQKPQIETRELPTETRTQLIANGVSCGPTRVLEGLSVSFELPHGGAWSGRAAADGSVRIDVNEGIRLPEGTTVRIVVDAVPAGLAAIVSPGMLVGEVSLARGAAAKVSTRQGQAREPVAGSR